MAKKESMTDQFKEIDANYMGSTSLVGKSMLTMWGYNNSARSVMFTSHLGQFVVLLKPQFPAVYTHGENIVGENSSGYKRIENRTTLVNKIKKYEKILGEEDTRYHKIFLYDQKEKRYSIAERQDCENLTERFGFQYQNEVIDSYNDNDTIEAGTVIYRSTSYDDYMNYGYGINVKTMYTTEPFTSEDACVISESLAERLTSVETHTITVGINQNDVLLNLYGDKENYKPFPDIGEFCDGELLAKRTLFNDQLLADFKDKSLNTIGPVDTLYFASGEVIDIKIYCNNEELDDNIFNEQIIKYLNAQTDYHKEIVKTCDKIMRSGLDYSQDIEYNYRRSSDFLNTDTKWKDDSVFGNIEMKFTIKSIKKAEIGQKITGRYGNKSVISQIRPDDQMPFYYDDNGNKVIIELLLNGLAIVNRTASFPLYEMHINFASGKVRSRLQTLKTLKEKEDLLFKYLDILNAAQSMNEKRVYQSLSKKEQEEYFHDVINDGIYIHQDNIKEDIPVFYRMLSLSDAFDFIKPYDVYINMHGREIKTLNPAYIGDMYILKLKQTSTNGFSGRNLGSIDSRSLPERSYKNKSHTERVSSTPIRFGEYELLNFAIGMSSEDIQLFSMLYRTSEEGRRYLAKKMLLGEDNFKMPTKFTSRTSEIFKVLLKSLGKDLIFDEGDGDEIIGNDDKYYEMFTYKGKQYFTTKFQFMFIKRQKDIEEEILSKHGIIDTPTLERLVAEEMIRKKYLIDIEKTDYKTLDIFRDSEILEELLMKVSKE